MAREANGSWQEITWDDAIARLAAKLGPAGNRVAVISGAGRGTFSDLLPNGSGLWAGGWFAIEPFDSEPLRAANRQVFGLDQLAASRLRQGQIHPLLRRRFPGDLARAPWRTSAASPSRTASAGGDVAKFVYLGSPDESHRTQRRRVAVRSAWLRGRAGAGDGQRAAGGAGRRTRAAEPRSAAFTPEMAARKPDFRPPPSSAWLTNSARLARASPWPAASAASMPAHRGLRRSEHPELRRREHRRDCALRRRIIDTGGRVRCVARPCWLRSRPAR